MEIKDNRVEVKQYLTFHDIENLSVFCFVNEPKELCLATYEGYVKLSTGEHIADCWDYDTDVVEIINATLVIE